MYVVLALILINKYNINKYNYEIDIHVNNNKLYNI